MNAGQSAAARILREPRLRGEIGWTLTTRLVDVLFPFLQMKLLTNLLTTEQFAEYNLAQTAVALGHTILIIPVLNAYQRYFHAAPEEGAARTAGLQLLRWISIATGGLLVLAAGISAQVSPLLRWETWTLLAAGAVFAADRWRLLSLEMFEFQRKKRNTALFHLGFQILVVAGFYFVLKFAHLQSATAALLVYAAAAAPLAFLAIRGLWCVFLPREGMQAGRLPALIRTLGVPYAVLLSFQWVQTYTDRYMLNSLVSEDAAGRYVGVFQVCGVPYLVMFQTLSWLVLPIAYNRVKDATQPQQLWSADRVILAAIGVYAVVGVLMLVFYWGWGGWLTTLLTKKEYEMSATTTLIIAAGRFLQCFALLVQVVFAVHQKMTASLLFRVAGALLTVPLCWVLIDKWQIEGAAAGSALAGLVYLVILAIGPGGFVWLMLETRRGVIAAGRASEAHKGAMDGI